MNHDGLLMVDKPAGCTSHDVVAMVRRALKQKKVGHCGTLDPMATGLLLVTAGRATRLTRFLIGAPKVYLGTAVLGTATDTYDAHGEVTGELDASNVQLADIASSMAEMTGDYEQTAPPYSAKKVDGRKLYELARAGLEVPVQKSIVQVFRLHPRGEFENGRVTFELACASGTYARSIIHDLGQRLHCGAHLGSLRRTGIGPFTLEGAIDADSLEDMAEVGGPSSVPATGWIPFDQIPLPFKTLSADSGGEKRIAHGQTLLAPGLDAEEGDWVRIVDSLGRLLAVGAVAENLGGRHISVVQPKIVFT